VSKAAEKPAFIRHQYEFAAHIRDPQAHARPADVEDRRMAIYRELFYNNVEGFLANAFPVLKQILDEKAWHRMARDFYARHRCHSPLFLEIPREFLNYLEQERGEQAGDPPFLRELAHYEWVELALSVAEDTDSGSCDPEADLLATRPVLSSLAWPLSYSFEVHRIGPDYQPDQPGRQPTYLLVYRNADDEVGFIELNAVSARLFGLLEEESSDTGYTVLAAIADELGHPDPQVVIDGGLGMLEEWRTRGIVLGGRS